jgi:hypothetical protein
MSLNLQQNKSNPDEIEVDYGEAVSDPGVIVGLQL